MFAIHLFGEFLDATMYLLARHESINILEIFFSPCKNTYKRYHNNYSASKIMTV